MDRVEDCLTPDEAICERGIRTFLLAELYEPPQHLFAPVAHSLQFFVGLLDRQRRCVEHADVEIGEPWLFLKLFCGDESFQ